MNTLIDDLVAANHILYHQGVVDGFGHVSVRHPEKADRFLMSKAKAPGRVEPADIMELDMDAKAVVDDGRPLYLERFIHTEVYKIRPDANSVVHSHSPSVVPFTVSTVPLRPVHNTTSFLPDGVPVFDMFDAFGITNNLITDVPRGKAVAEALGKHPVLLMRGHGSVIVGPDLRRTVMRAVYTEANARMQLQATMLGGPIAFMHPEECQLIEGGRSKGVGDSVDRVWQMWLEAAKCRG